MRISDWSSDVCSSDLVQPAERAQAARRQHADVLQVALAPAAVALGVVDQGRRRLLEAAAEIVRQPDLPAGAPQQRRLDEVVAEDLAAEGLSARQHRQPAVLDEGLHADDRVVAPVVGIALQPVGEAGREGRAVDAAGELLAACEERSEEHTSELQSLMRNSY